jgi:hypothetical protein
MDNSAGHSPHYFQVVVNNSVLNFSFQATTAYGLLVVPSFDHEHLRDHWAQLVSDCLQYL